MLWNLPSVATTLPPAEEAIFCLLFVGLDKKQGAGRGRDPAVLMMIVWFLRNLNIKFAGPGRQPGYFLCKAPKKVSKEMAWLRRYVSRKGACLDAP
jgi:hypothetical protein